MLDHFYVRPLATDVGKMLLAPSPYYIIYDFSLIVRGGKRQT